jgi:hypothetical protein
MLTVSDCPGFSAPKGQGMDYAGIPEIVHLERLQGEVANLKTVFDRSATL